MSSIWGLGMLNPNKDYTQVGSGKGVVVVYCEGEPSVVVFEISPSHVKTFRHPHAVRRLCVGSVEAGS